MDHVKQFYINGQWVDPLTSDTLAVINPATEQPIESIAMGGADDVAPLADMSRRVMARLATMGERTQRV